ncbi:MAG: bifunctional demethylmenaquinone methyltransferase/2-methoxy-6-polyprenyl-1,4-benzoquinol methylase UbiE [Pseudomonadota bacterium]
MADLAPDAGQTVNFGFEDIAAEDKQSRVHGVFSSVAQDYDRMNDAMSFGLHRAWKNRFVSLINPRHDEIFLDVAGGTGDIAFRLQDRVEKRGGEADITVLDINADMLAEGRRRAESAERTGFIWLEGDAEALELPTNQFDAYSIAFGIRNVTHIENALAEAYRVLKRGGRFYCLEFTSPVLPALQPIYEAYSFNVVPRMGERIAGDAASYQYLVESIRTFPSRSKFKAMIEAAGFANTAVQTLSGGIVAIHSGWKI